MQSEEDRFKIDPFYEAIRAPLYVNFSRLDEAEGDSFFDTYQDEDEEDEMALSDFSIEGGAEEAATFVPEAAAEPASSTQFEVGKLLPDREFDSRTPPKMRSPLSRINIPAKVESLAIGEDEEATKENQYCSPKREIIRSSPVMVSSPLKASVSYQSFRSKNVSLSPETPSVQPTASKLQQKTITSLNSFAVSIGDEEECVPSVEEDEEQRMLEEISRRRKALEEKKRQAEKKKEMLLSKKNNARLNGYDSSDLSDSSIASYGSNSRRQSRRSSVTRELTVPVTFNFATEERAALRRASLRSSIGSDSSDSEPQRSTPAEPGSKWTGKLTEPCSPVFRTKERRTLRDSMRIPMLSSEERDLAETQNQFKALPLNPKVLDSVGDLGVPRMPKRGLTIPVSPLLHTKERYFLRSTNKRKRSDVEDEYDENGEPDNFDVNSLAKTFGNGTGKRTSSTKYQRLSLTQPVPFSFATEDRAMLRRASVACESPASSGSERESRVTGSKRKRTVTEPKPFTFATEDRKRRRISRNGQQRELQSTSQTKASQPKISSRTTNSKTATASRPSRTTARPSASKTTSKSIGFSRTAGPPAATQQQSSVQPKKTRVSTRTSTSVAKTAHRSTELKVAMDPPSKRTAPVQSETPSSSKRAMKQISDSTLNSNLFRPLQKVGKKAPVPRVAGGRAKDPMNMRRAVIR